MPLTRYPPIPDPSTDGEALRRTSMAMKETLEIMQGQRGKSADGVVTWQDLLDLGLIVPEQIPR